MSPAIVLEIECFLCHKIVHKINEPLAHFNLNNVCSTMNKRRLRTPNWSQTEKQYLLHLINVRSDVLLSRKNDGPNFSVEKDEAWNDILRMMIGEFGTKFTGSNLKKVKTQWQNMKRIAQLEANSYKKGDFTALFSKQSIEVCKILQMTPEIDYPCEIGQGDTSLWKESNAVDCDSSKINADIVDCDASVCRSNSCGVSNQYAEPPEMDVWDEMSETSSLAKVVVEDNEDSVDEVINICDREENELHVPSAQDDDVEEVAMDSALGQVDVAENAYSTEGKRLKLEILVEERRVIQAMREAAEINKIISEENLKSMIKSENLGLLGVFDNNMPSGSADGFGKPEIPREYEYFYRQHSLYLEHLKSDLLGEISFHEHQIRHHQDAVRRHRQNIENINNLSVFLK